MPISQRPKEYFSDLLCTETDQFNSWAGVEWKVRREENSIMIKSSLNTIRSLWLIIKHAITTQHWSVFGFLRWSLRLTAITKGVFGPVLKFSSLPGLGLRGDSPSWPAPPGCTRLGSGTFRRLAPARAAGRWWRWCGCVCVSSWADRLCLAPETCFRHCLHPSSARSGPRHTCWCISWCLASNRKQRISD